MRVTRVEADNSLVEKVMQVYGLGTKRAAVDFALRRLVGSYDRKAMLDLEGAGWGGDLDELRHSDPVQEISVGSSS